MTISEDYKIVSYDDLIATLIARRQELGLSQIELDYVSGLQEGYSGKLESWRHPNSGRKLGKVSMRLLLEALGVVLIVMTKDGNVLPRKHGRRLGPDDREPAWPNPAIVLKRERSNKATMQPTRAPGPAQMS